MRRATCPEFVPNLQNHTFVEIHALVVLDQILPGRELPPLILVLVVAPGPVVGDEFGRL